MNLNERMKIFQGKSCLITGATGGVGQALARELAFLGCHLFLTARSKEKLEVLINELRESTYAFSEPGDLRKEEDRKRIFEISRDWCVNIDILINNAADFSVKSLSDLDENDFDGCFDLNVKAPLMFIKACSEGMIKKGWGRIVNIGSSSAYGGFKGTSLYCASKHALLGLSRALFEELKEKGIRVLFPAPASMKTEMGKKVTWQDYETFIDPEEFAQQVIWAMSFDDYLVTPEIQFKRVITQ